MTRAGAAALFALIAAARIGGAQSASAPTCTFSPATFASADACQKASDLFAFLAPQVALAVAGGNPLPGDAGTLGGAGHRSLSLRAVVVDGYLPRSAVNIAPRGAVSSDFGAVRTPLPLPAADVAIGVFRGLPAGLTSVGGVDLLLGAIYLPSVSRDGVSIDAQKRFAWSYGLRVGVLQESALAPGIAVSWMRRTLPRSNFAYATSDDTLSVSDVEVRADALRLIAGKRFPLFGLAIGVGRDRYDARARVDAVVNDDVVTGRASLSGLEEQSQRTTAFANLSFGLSVLRVVGEIGVARSEDSRETVNRFGDRGLGDRRTYGSIGVTTRF